MPWPSNISNPLKSESVNSRSCSSSWKYSHVRIFLSSPSGVLNSRSPRDLGNGWRDKVKKPLANFRRDSTESFSNPCANVPNIVHPIAS